MRAEGRGQKVSRLAEHLDILVLRRNVEQLTCAESVPADSPREPRPRAEVADDEPTSSSICGSGRDQSRGRCGRGEPSRSADVAGVSPALVQMWQG